VAAILLGNGVGGRMATAPHYKKHYASYMQWLGDMQCFTVARVQIVHY